MVKVYSNVSHAAFQFHGVGSLVVDVRLMGEHGVVFSAHINASHTALHLVIVPVLGTGQVKGHISHTCLYLHVPVDSA